jgi:gliding motility-associated-like protein
MSIYNRYGQKVFSSADIAHGWDGNYRGLPQSVGAYLWIISFTDIDGENKTLQGTVLLLR